MQSPAVQWLPTPDAADYLGVSMDTLRRRRDVKGGYLVNGKHWRFAGDHANSKVVWAVDLVAAELNRRGMMARRAAAILREEAAANG